MEKTRFFVILVCLFISTLCPAQSQYFGSPPVTSFSRTDYHAGTQNWYIQQGESGIIYFGNNKGLLEFDGVNWRTFELPNRTIVRSFAFAESGKIYIGGQDEIGYLEPDEHGKNIYVSLTHLIPESQKSFEDIWQIFLKSGSIYFCSRNAVFRFREDQITVINPEGGEFENFFFLNDQLVFQDKTAGLFTCNDTQLNPISGGNIFPNQRIVSILPYNSEQSLIITATEGLFLMGQSEITPWETASTDFLINNQAYCAIKLSDENYAIGTTQDGLLIMDPAGNPVRFLNKTRGLQNNTILSICQDRQQNLWLGLDNGVDYAEINSPFSVIQSESGIEGTGYAAYIHDKKLYLGTNQGLYYTEWDNNIISGKSEKFKPVGNAIGQVWNINHLGEDVIICQHKGAGFLENDKIRPFSKIEGAWKFMELKAYPGYAIEGTYFGLNLYSKSTPDSDWKFIKHLDGFTESARVIEQDSEGNIWVSHAYKGLYKIELSPDLETIQKINFYNKDHGLPVDLFINVVKIRNELVFTTPKGVYKYEKEQDRFIPHQEFNEIFGEDANIHRLLEDELGNIWFSVDSDFGLIKVREKGVFNKLELVYFNQIQEDLVDGFEHVYAHDQNNIFIGTEKGFVHYNPLHDKNFDFVFEMLIRKVSSITEGDSVVFWGNRLESMAPEGMGFNHHQNDFRFAYAVPYYEKIDQVRYRYMLQGFDNDWSEWTSKTEKEYTNLGTGDYQFKVQARNTYNQLSSEKVFSFTIYPPWYYSIYAKIFYFLLGIGSFLGLLQYISKRDEKNTLALMEEQAKTLQQKEAEFKKEVEKSEDEIIQLRNEKLQSDINLKNSQLASATMHLVQKSEILMKIKGDLANLLKEVPKDSRRKIELISRTIDADIRLDNNWEQFEIYFDQVHENFFKRLRQQYPDLTPKDQKLCAYLRMNLSTKEIAPLLNISVRGVEISRYRLRKKLNLDSETNLVATILDL
ncbi:MAG: hypothetical protein KDC34_16950 [Saprospiraceae bacterium]|nr:hypothetical protein [Saprospiraceae bacterium]